MESNLSLIFFSFGLSLLPQIHSDGYPSLFLKKKELLQYHSYVAAHELRYFKLQRDDPEIFLSFKYPLYKACPAENETLYPEYALNVQGPLADFKTRPLKEFLKGSFDEHNCPSPIKPIVLKYKDGIQVRGKFTPTGAQLYDIGFLIQQANDDYSELWKMYENFTQGYEFINFLTVTMDKSSRSTFSVRHQIISGQLLEPDTDWIPFESNKENVHIYGFDVNILYTEGNQIRIFPGQPDRILVKVQLAPHGDFLLYTWKLTSFVDLNTTAMWMQLCAQWKKIETFVRKVAQKVGELTVETGAAKILSLPDSKNKQQSIYLDDEQKFPLHKYIWKLVQFNQSHENFSKAILIVMHNDPFTPNQIPICRDMGINLGWMVSNDDYKTGLTYVCRVTPDITSQLHDDFKVRYTSFEV